MDWKEIEQRLCERVEEVCRHLLPNGKRNGAEWCVGSVNGEAGDSLRVHLAGGASMKAGVWADFADSDKKGKTLMSLWCHVRGQAFAVCIQEAKEWLGIRDDWREGRVQRAGISRERTQGTQSEERGRGLSAREMWERCRPLTEGGAVWQELVAGRRIDPMVLEAYEVRERWVGENVPRAGLAAGWAMVFAYYAPHEREERSEVEQLIAAGSYPDVAKGKSGIGLPQSKASGGTEPGPGRTPTWLKYERVERPEGKKVEWTTPGPEKCLWGMQLQGHAIFRRTSHLLIVEGEKDALSWASYGCGNWHLPGAGMGGGVLPVSVPFGAKWRPAPIRNANGFAEQRPSANREWLDRCWDWMQGFETIFVGMDMDEEGEKAAADIISEIGMRRCRLVVLPGRGNGKFTEANKGNEGGK